MKTSSKSSARRAATPDRDWTSTEPKFSRGRVAKALELKAAGRPLREIQRRTGIHYSYVCKLAKDIANDVPGKQLHSERARKAAIALLQQEKTKLTTRLAKVNVALARYLSEEAVDAAPPSA